MARILSCYRGHQARWLRTPDTYQVLTCIECSVATRLHADRRECIRQWNETRDVMWKRYTIRWWTHFYRWWNGYND